LFNTPLSEYIRSFDQSSGAGRESCGFHVCRGTCYISGYVHPSGLLRGQKQVFCLLKRNYTAVKNGTSSQNQKKTSKAEINTISGVSSFLMMPGSNKVKVLPIIFH
jgi:hypothetical protein